MALIIPPYVEDSETHRTEKLVFDFFKHLDDPKQRYVIFHSYTLLRQDESIRTKGLLAGEIDFLVLDLESALLIVIEVKGGNVQFNPNKIHREQWTFNNKPDNRNRTPLEQLQSNEEVLRISLNRRLGKALMEKISSELCLAIPETVYFRKNLPIPVWSQKEFLRLRDNLLKLSQGNKSKVTSNELLLLKKDLSRKFQSVIIKQYNEKTEKIEKKLAELTDGQLKFLDETRALSKVSVEGCAGSGKTLMVTKKARELAAEGKKVLILCYNIFLCEQNIFPQVESFAYSESIEAVVYQEFCERILRQYNALPEPPAKGESREEFSRYYEEVIPDAMLSIIENLNGVYDAIIIDEAQDFHRHYWDVLEELFDSKTLVYIFFDKDQRLNSYNRDKFQSIIDSTDSFQLGKNCRNTANISDLIQNFTNNKILIPEKCPAGDEVAYHICDKTNKLETLRKLLHELTSEKGISPERITIIGKNRWSRYFDSIPFKIGNFFITDGEPGKKNITYYNFHKIKGCEFDYVIAYDVSMSWQKREIYTTLSRAKLNLNIILDSEAMEELFQMNEEDSLSLF